MPARGLIAQAIFASRCRPLSRCCRPASSTVIPGIAGALTLPSISPTSPQTRPSSSSSTRWLSRQSSDPQTRASKLSALKSRAAFKLLEINSKHRLFAPGQTVVDLGYAPGSWSQVAKSRVGESGRVVGIDVIPAQPPRGVSTLQGDFLSAATQKRLVEFVRGDSRDEGVVAEQTTDGEDAAPATTATEDSRATTTKKHSLREQDLAEGRVVDVVLSDMCAPWPLVMSTWVNSVNNPYRRMMNTSGTPFRDHAGSMDLCLAALTFAYDTVVTGGHFLCKFYQGPEDKSYEMRLRRMFERVHRIKPESSRKESREAYFVGLRRRPGVERESVLGDV